MGFWDGAHTQTDRDSDDESAKTGPPGPRGRRGEKGNGFKISPPVEIMTSATRN